MNQFRVVVIPALILTLIGRNEYSLLSHLIWFANLLPFLGVVISYAKNDRIDYYSIPLFFAFLYYIAYHFSYVHVAFDVNKYAFAIVSLFVLPAILYLTQEAWRRANGS